MGHVLYPNLIEFGLLASSRAPLAAGSGAGILTQKGRQAAGGDPSFHTRDNGQGCQVLK